MKNGLFEVINKYIMNIKNKETRQINISRQSKKKKI